VEFGMMCVNEILNPFSLRLRLSQLPRKVEPVGAEEPYE